MFSKTLLARFQQSFDLKKFLVCFLDRIFQNPLSHQITHEAFQESRNYLHYLEASGMKYFYRKNPKTETGASLAEYALLLALIALVVFASIVPFGQTVSGFFSSVPAVFGG